MKMLFSMKILFSLIFGIFIFVLPGSAAPKPLLLNVPFTSQAPLAEWRDQRQQDGCEEAAAAMAMAWVGNEQGITKANWRLRILILSNFEFKKYGEYRDISLSDMKSWLFNDYFNYQSVEIKAVKTAADIIQELERGRIVLTPMDGRALKNPYFNPPGPERHMIVIKGYDYDTQEFIVNDPGTRRGESYRYSSKIILKAIRAYSSGYHQPIKEVVKEMLVVSK